MQNVNFNVEFIQNMAKSSPKRRGSFNLFFKLNNKVGVKATLFEQERDSNYETQKKAADFGLGPEVFGKIDFIYQGEIMYAYLTEIVPVFPGPNDGTLNTRAGDIKRKKFVEFFNNNIDQLFDDLDDMIDFEFSDNHRYNVGIKKKKLICIDFDDVNARFLNKTKLPSDIG